MCNLKKLKSKTRHFSSKEETDGPNLIPKTHLKRIASLPPAKSLLRNASKSRLNSDHQPIHETKTSHTTAAAPRAFLILLSQPFAAPALLFVLDWSCAKVQQELLGLVQAQDVLIQQDAAPANKKSALYLSARHICSQEEFNEFESSDNL